MWRVWERWIGRVVFGAFHDFRGFHGRGGKVEIRVLRVGRWDLVGSCGLGFVGVVVCWF